MPQERGQPSRHEGGLGPEFEALLHRIDQRRSVEAERGIKAWLLAPTPELYAALMAGERVPWNKLNYVQAMRYGLRRRVEGGRVALDDFWDVRRD